MTLDTLAPPVFLQDRLDHWARHNPDGEAVAFGDASYTWSLWQERIHKLTDALRKAGIKRGDRILTFELNHLAIVEATFAAAALGAGTVVGNFRLAPGQLKYILEDSAPKVVFCGAGLKAVLQTASAEAPVLRTIIVGGDADEYEPFLNSGQPPAAGAAEGGTGVEHGHSVRGADVDPDDTVLIMYTSGTTGRPKGVELTHRSVNVHSAVSNAGFKMVPGDVNMVGMPMFHVGGSCYFQAGIYAGARTIYLRDPAGPSMMAAIADGATHAFLVPAVIQAVLAAGPEAAAAVAPLKKIAYGASPMPLPLLQKTLNAWPNTELAHVFGMTEMSGIGTMMQDSDHRNPPRPEALQSVGRPLPGLEVRIADPVTHEPLPTGTNGEIQVRGAQNMKGYLNKPEATAAAFTADGFLCSGDIGHLDGDGYLYMVDRLKDMIISGGENIYSPEVENILMAAPGVAEGIVIGVPDPKWVETVKAVVVREPGSEATEADIIAFCRDRLAHYQCPTSVDFVEELPRNATGKILKRELREPYWRGHDRDI
ncbi:acyl-CoA synthetase (AMP-forming)/AMP-acid ligase II [Arthrobacter stackebrandtii]|uniref:Acyl-CoA synthetase (AMP-forming)/AMP-acid ligase II n=1 Tax=Arthrobacter stackebrandtii TaxID=272161 RepID=A0ABS4YY36_9MICC|nr:AMP-binding protein [Arthrobacter stackebrandtii]MBP2413646.1 acyl-CoA synthetase (AMP-forming)/AMP-acid ligase II [Arthrobacter stackebrandtii]PYG99951.1 long-chain fatty acid--CoA ligase [Arthrobacter stackebrandtii]